MPVRKRKLCGSDRMVKCHYCGPDGPIVRFSNLPRHTKNNHGPPSTHPPREAGLTSVFDLFSSNVKKKSKPNPIPPPNPPDPTPPVDYSPTDIPVVHIIVYFPIGF